jgi:hypothetical protein
MLARLADAASTVFAALSVAFAITFPPSCTRFGVFVTRSTADRTLDPAATS